MEQNKLFAIGIADELEFSDTFAFSSFCHSAVSVRFQACLNTQISELHIMLLFTVNLQQALMDGASASNYSHISKKKRM